LPYTNIVLGYPRVQSVALEPLFFANFLLIPIFLTAGKYLKSEKIFEKYWLILALFLTAFVLTVSRGAYLALGISGVIFIMFLLAHKHFKKVLGIISALIIAIAISFCGIKYLNGNLAGEYALNHSVSYLQDTESDSSALDRIRTFRLAWDYFKERPALGNGLGSFGFIVPMLGADKYQTVNNIYLEILTETGVIGALLFALFIIYYVLTSIAAIRKNKKGINRLSSYGLLLGILAIFIQYNFFSTLYIIYVWAFMALLRREAVGEET
jgi:O-antigen ligase